MKRALSAALLSFVATTAAAGVAWSQPWGSLAFELAQDSREFQGQTAPHRFGSAALNVAF